MDVQVVEQTIEYTCDQYEPASGDMALTECDKQGMTTDMDNTIDCDDDSAEPSYPLAAEMGPWDYEESAAFWAFAESDEDDSFSNDDLDHAAPMLSFNAEKGLIQRDSRSFQRYIDDEPVVSPLAVIPSNLTLPVSSEERDDSRMDEPLATQSHVFFEKGSLQRRSSSKGDAQVSKFKSSFSDITDDYLSLKAVHCQPESDSQLHLLPGMR